MASMQENCQTFGIKYPMTVLSIVLTPPFLKSHLQKCEAFMSMFVKASQAQGWTCMILVESCVRI